MITTKKSTVSAKLKNNSGIMESRGMLFLIVILSLVVVIYSLVIPLLSFVRGAEDKKTYVINTKETRYRRTYIEQEQKGTLRLEEGTGNVHIYPYPVINMNENTGLIYIGDSRMVGMDRICHMSGRERTYVIAREGEGYYYLTSHALPEAERIMSSNPSIDEWIFLLALGVNDLTNVDYYCNTYAEIAAEYPTYILSVNPVSLDSGVTNKNIEAFNERLKDIPDSYYIDCYSIMLEEGFNAPDGLHYSYDTYQNINAIINEALGIQ